MAATIATPQPPAQPPAPGQPAPPPGRGHRARPARPGLIATLTPQGMPAKIRAMLVFLVVLSLAWGGIGAWVVATHASAASSLAHADEPYSQYAQKLYLAIADADVTITTSFLVDSQPVPQGKPRPSTLTARQQFDTDLAHAGDYLALLKNSNSDPRFTAAVAAIASGLPRYEGAVTIAETEYAQGITPTGDSAMEVASEEAHLTLLPAARTIYQFENNAVLASSAEATSLPAVILAVGLALIAVILLVMGQRWLGRRTHRVFNRGLLSATAALLISAVWLVVAFGLARSDMSTAIGQGSNPAEKLAQASIDVQQIRGDSILNVIARSGSTSLPADAHARAKEVGPGPGSLLDAAAKSGNGKVASALAKAIVAAPAWYAVNDRGYQLGDKNQYAAEQASVLDKDGPSTSGGGYATVQGGISAALTAARDTFNSSASSGASAYGQLEAVIIIASLLMAGASAWGLSRRLAEYG
jgi:hypothetical protein